MHVVVVDWDIAFPADSGKRLRTLNLMLQLADRHAITYFSRGDGNSPAARRAREFFQDHGINTVFADVPVPSKKGWRFYGRIAANLFSTLPYAVAVHESRSFEAQLEAYARQHRIDVWQLEWTPYINMLQGVNGARTVAVAHNVDSLIWQRYYEAEVQPAKRWYIKRQWHRFERFEQQAFHQATRVVAVSDDDAALLQERFGLNEVDVVENGVDVAYFSDVPIARNPREILFLGSLDWRPNLDSVRLFLDQIFPRVLEEEPAAQLTVVGRHPPKWLAERIDQQPNISLHANVPDVRPYLGQAAMMAVPLRIGGGSRLKIIEALTSGLPVVATRVAVEGLQLRAGDHYKLADSVDEMAAAIVHWIRFPREAETTAKRGRTVVIDHYSWNELATSLELVWKKTALDHCLQSV